MKRIALVALGALVLACSGEPLPPPNPGPAKTAAPAASSAAAAAPAPPAFRLPATVVPRKIAATLTLVPTEATFRGEADIDLTLAAPARVLWLHATDLTVTEAHLEVGGARRPARVVPGGEDFLGFAFDDEVPAGPARLHVVYSGKVSSEDDRGVFREKEGAHDYLYSQFQTTYARRAIPCFDEPGLKIPWQLTLRVRASDVALSNTPVLEEKVGEDGFKTVRFAETKPLPSYLVAFAVGPFDLVEAGRAGKNRTPVRLAVVKGHDGESGYASKAALRIVDLLEEEFGVPYPYEKLDLVTIPQLASFGAMENAGLITVAARYLVIPPDQDTVRQRYGVASYLGHEIAHQWFGDLVTPAWWDDIWLNEGFATWMEERKISPRVDPAFAADLDVVAGIAGVMDHDSLVSARKVRQEVLSNEDIQSAFDGITYSKGGALLGMFEAWMGPAEFQKGVKVYLERFAFKNATSDDFLTALGEGAKKDVKAAFSTFLDQPGVPVVKFGLACDASGAKLALEQERFFPIGSKGAAGSSTWQIPVCVRYGAGKQSGRACTLLTGKTGELPLPAVAGQKGGCPEWVMPKEAGTGYYRAAYGPKDVASLLDKGRGSKLATGERMSLVYDMRALASNGRFPMGEALSRLPDLLKDPNAYVQSSGAGMLGWLRDDFVPQELRPNARRFVGKVATPRARALGWTSKPGDASEVRRLRSHLLDILVELGDDSKLFAEARALAEGWLERKTSIDADGVELVLRGAASRGDKALFDRMVGAVRKEKDDRRRDEVLSALAAFRDPALARAALDLFFDAAIDPRAGIRLFWSQERANRAVFWSFLKERFDALMERIPADARPYVLSLTGYFCDEGSRAEVEAFLKERAPKIPGASRPVAQALESISLCVAKRDAYKESLGAFLKKQ